MRLETPLRRFARNGLSVSTIAAQFWCEKRVELSFLHPLPRTEEMSIGRARHDELHKEIAELISVRITSPADMIGVRLHNMVAGLATVLKEKRTRELPVIGFLYGLNTPVIGQIDELRVEGKRTRIIDHKTRRSDKMPSLPQIRVAEFQLMTYYRLLKEIRSEALDLKDVLNFYDLDEISLITQEFLAQLEPAHRPKERNLLKLGSIALRFAKRLPELSENLEVVYENQETNRIIGSHRFQFSEEAWKQDFEFASQYWLGNRPAKPVNEANRWKCDYCGFKERSICPVWTD